MGNFQLTEKEQQELEKEGKRQSIKKSVEWVKKFMWRDLIPQEKYFSAKQFVNLSDKLNSENIIDQIIITLNYYKVYLKIITELDGPQTAIDYWKKYIEEYEEKNNLNN